ncbi:PIR protein CIR protein [Plasmodium vinckei vinckei]|uniref:PIR protein CIR protein n=1 Tax=Plasmodium vinckei vinckei TaxID=54757 RepID=A0A449BMR1_PLAVN|nr:PIR protein CIR protein [Plasmodium vinckei vinckei]VEV54714.1 PIR protein CIR protein [Plasmodium vinckei vinckei]
MGKSSYSIEDVYKEIITIDGAVGVEHGGSVEYVKAPISVYCPYNSTFKSNFCNNYFEKASCGVIYLLTNLKYKNVLDYDKLAEYAILWLSYKLNQNPEYNGKKLNHFYTKYIEKNNDYNKKKYGDNSLSYKDIMDKKKDLMDIKIKEISNYYEALKTLCNMYSECNKTVLDCNNCSKKANEFVQNFEKLNKDSNINENTSYIKLLSTLSNDYYNLKKVCENDSSNNFPTLSPVKTPPNKLLPALSAFSVIPVFLGIAYKYSLFGIDKLFQRQYIRKKLKNIKKKMKLNI